MMPASASPQPVYRASGHVYGTYCPSKNDFRIGTLLTSSEEKIRASLNRSLLTKLNIRYPAQLDDLVVFDEPHFWLTYPKTCRGAPLSLELVQKKKPPSAQALAALVNRFTVVGEVNQCYPECTIVLVRYNDQMRKPKSRRPSEGFLHLLYGSIPQQAMQQIWQFELERQGDRLVIQTSHLYEGSSRDTCEIVPYSPERLEIS